MKRYYHIYQIRNIINEKVYVGSAVNVTDRWNLHIRQLSAKKHHSIKLQRAWDKYGQDKFSFEIIEPLKNKRDLISAEQDYIDFLDSYRNGYNCCPQAGSVSGIKWSDLSRKRLSEAKKGKTSNRKGVKLSDSTKDKLRLANIGKKLSPETIEKLRGRTFFMSQSAKDSISIARGLKNFYTILFEDGQIKEINLFKEYCKSRDINFKVLHQWSIANRESLSVHPRYKLKILKLTVK